MSNRFQTLTYTTASIAAGASSAVGDSNHTGMPNLFNVVKVKVTQNTAGGTFDYKIFRKDTLAAADLLEWWDNVTPALYDPMDDSTGAPAEAIWGLVFVYDDADGTGEFHDQITNNDGSAHTYTVTLEYEEVPKFDSSGNVTFRAALRVGDGSVGAPSYSFANDSDTGLAVFTLNALDFVGGGTRRGYIDSSGFVLPSAGAFQFNSAALGSGSPDVLLVRDAANVLALKNSTTAQEIRVYGTTTGPKYASLAHNGTDTIISTVGNDAIRFNTNGGISKWLIAASATDYSFIPGSDNAYDLGSTANRARSGYFGTAVLIGTNPASVGGVRLAHQSAIVSRNAANSNNLGLVTGDTDRLLLGFAGGTPLTDIILNYDSEDTNVIMRSDSNSNHFVSDAGAFSGVGAFGFGAAVDLDSFIIVNSPAWTGRANSNTQRVLFYNGAAITVPAGTSPVVANVVITEPNITATGTVSDAYSLYISGAPTEGTRNGALWVGGGTSRFDGVVQHTGVAFASLPTGVAGMVQYVSDSNTVTWGATIAGGGANKVLAFFNGTNWTVAGK